MWTKPLLSRRNSGSSAGKLFVRVRLQCVLCNRLTPSSFQGQERSSFDGRRVIPEQYVGLMSECVQRVIHHFFPPLVVIAFHIAICKCESAPISELVMFVLLLRTLFIVCLFKFVCLNRGTVEA